MGCGTGALTDEILASSSPAWVTGIDPSDGFVGFAREHVRDARVEFARGDAQSLQVKAASYDAVISGLVLNFVPDSAAGVSECARATRRGGIVGAYVWDYRGEMQMIRRLWDAAAALDRAAKDLDEGRRFAVCQPDRLRDLFAAAGLRGIEVRHIDVPTVFCDFEDYWSPFLGGQGPAPAYAMSLSDERRALLRERLRETLPARDDGSIHLIARAWAVKGERG